jgi:hypothetical protein
MKYIFIAIKNIWFIPLAIYIYLSINMMTCLELKIICSFPFVQQMSAFLYATIVLFSLRLVIILLEIRKK